jgi:TonB family protein
MTWWHYLTLVNIYLVLFYGFYWILLKRGTFFQLNRFYLIASIFFSFLIPVMQSEWVQNLFITQRVQYGIYSNPVFIHQFKPLQETGASIGEIALIIYVAGIVCLSARFIWQLFKLKRKMADPETSEAYSFFANVTIGDSLKTNKSINTHELVHAEQWHSLDVVLVELVMIVNWFNPIVYLYRMSIKHLHEFIADKKVLGSGVDKSEYALLLVSYAFNTSVNQLVNTFFNKTLLKQRIMMINKKQSNRVMLAKYGLVAPLFILMLILSSAALNNSKPIGLWLPNNGDKIYTNVEKTPEFPGGINAFYNFLGRNIRYPARMRENNIQGKIIVTFVVEKDGALTGIKVVKSIAKEASDEAVRVFKASPKWRPGMVKGKPVRCQYTVPVNFTLAP